jgi:ribosomal protein S27AE
VNELTAPELTGEWEYKLSQMEKGKISRDEFMREIAQMTQVIVKRAKEYDNDTIPATTTPAHACPNCGGVVKENYRRFACTKCEFSMSKTPGGRQFEIEEVEQLLKDRTIGPLQGFRSKMGRPFAAILRIVRDEEIKNFKLEFDFGQNDDSEDSEPVDFTGQTRWARARSAMAACTKWAWRMCANIAWPNRRPATSAAAASSCSRRSCQSRWPSCSTTARPTCCQASSRSARAVRSRPSGEGQGRQDQLRVRRAQSQGASQRQSCRSDRRGRSGRKKLR